MAPKKQGPLKFGAIEPLSEYYEDVDGKRYCVSRLIEEAKNLPVFDLPLAGLDLSQAIWQKADIFGLAYHCKKVNRSDLSFPIILAWDGAIADGRHRIIKALMLGKTTIKAKRITWRLTPCKDGDA